MPKFAVASTYSKLDFHLVFATKERKPIIGDDWREELHAYLGGTIGHLGGVAHAVGGTEDHVHIFCGIRPAMALSDMVREVKKSSSVWAAGRCPGFAWQEGYGAFSVGRAEWSAVHAYVMNQEEHHRTKSAIDEFLEMLGAHGIDPGPWFE